MTSALSKVVSVGKQVLKGRRPSPPVRRHPKISGREGPKIR